MGSAPGDPLEGEMTTHSSILSKIIPGTEEPGRLKSLGLQSNWVTENRVLKDSCASSCIQLTARRLLFLFLSSALFLMTSQLLWKYTIKIKLSGQHVMHVWYVCLALSTFLPVNLTVICLSKLKLLFNWRWGRTGISLLSVRHWCKQLFCFVLTFCFDQVVYNSCITFSFICHLTVKLNYS